MNMLHDTFSRELMEILKSFLPVPPTEGELLPFLFGSKGDQKRTYNLGFYSNARFLMSLNYYEPILRVIVGVLTLQDPFVIERMFDCLQMLEGDTQIPLTQMGSDYFKRCYQHRVHDGFIDEDIAELDVYHDDLNIFYSLEAVPNTLLRMELPNVLYPAVCGMDFSFDNLTEQDIDRIVAAALEKRQAQLDQELQQAHKDNEEDAAMLAQNPDCIVSSRTAEFTTPDDLHRVVPALLAPLVKALEVKSGKGRNAELCYYALEKYLLPDVSMVLSAGSGRHKSALAVMARFCVDYIHSLLYSSLAPVLSSIDGAEPDSIYLAAVGEENSESPSAVIGRPVLALCRRRCGFAQNLAQLLSASGNLLRDFVPKETYSEVCSQTAFLLFFAQKGEDACHFILSHFYDISIDTRCKPFFLILLSRCILHTSCYTRANALYGLFNQELFVYEDSGRLAFDLVRQMLRFFEMSRQHIEAANDRNQDDGRAWFDLIYGDFRLDRFFASLKAKLDRNQMICYDEFRLLSNLLHAFSNREGILLSSLGIPPQGSDGNTLEGALPPKLRQIGSNLADNGVRQLKPFFNIQRQYQYRKQISLHLQSHLLELQKQEVQKSLDALNELRQSCSAQGEDEEQNEQIYARMVQLCENMFTFFHPSAADQQKCKDNILKSSREFARDCLKDESVDLLGKIPATIRDEFLGELITSEIVSNFLTQQQIRNLDFSPAIISLTKALELLLNNIYNRMDIRPAYFCNELQSSFFDRNNVKKENLTLGDCIYLLKDSHFVNYNRYTRRLEEAPRPYSPCHFDSCGGNNVLDFSVLKRLSSSEMRFNGFDGRTRRNTEESMHFSPTDTRQNKMLFIKGLEYMRDNYRNKVAHKSVIALTTMEDCRDLMLYGKHLLWILLAMLK